MHVKDGVYPGKERLPRRAGRRWFPRRSDLFCQGPFEKMVRLIFPLFLILSCM
ncbi:hypothetical protein SAMN02745206_02559 [Desulfacinum infernum DSM 9756]|jgi:hypothetical protein|uniref:Uncharacterized protein n=1 Tax=Desulfacinum infernum DSM 9756 TaxID=1121391 RepID=A0A1M5E146_9BACT|nr:hypothetical protein SAMN02745206_02559 [Desulfacinum infernum DSM 9756]